MNIILDFTLCFMETLSHWSSCYVVMFMFLTTVSEGSACQAPSSPQCFRSNDTASVYMCEWSMDTTESNVTFDIYFDEKPFKGFKKTWCHLNEELLIKFRPVNILVKAYVGNSSCESPKSTVVLGHTVKYDAPQIISTSWSKNNLSLMWKVADNYPALVEVCFRREEHPTEPWQNRSANTTNDTLLHQVTVVDLQNDSAYQFRIRQRSNKAQNPLWSKWSQVFIVPAELKHKPEVTMTTSLSNGSRLVRLSWKPMPRAAAVRGVTYRLNEIQSACGCLCVKMCPLPLYTDKHTYDVYVSYSAVSISVVANNSAGDSPPAIVQVPAKAAADLKACNKTLQQVLQVKKKSCHELYELEDEGPRPGNVITLTRKNRKQRANLMKNIKDYVRYLYFEHRCYERRPQTVQMCIFYRKESAPNRAPHDFVALSETPTSASLSWKAIPLANQRGHITHYNVCSIKISSENKSKECFNVSTSLLKFSLNNLTPGSKYNISLAGVSRAGEGPAATVTIKTLPEKPVNVWWSFGLLFAFFLMSTLCTVALKRIKNKIFPPVPTPVIPNFKPCQPESQEMLEEKEEVHDLKLEQLPPEDTEATTVLRGEWDEGSDEDSDDERRNSRMSGEISDESPASSDESQRSHTEGDLTDLEQVDNEIAILIYRNGLVFDLRTDSP